MLHFCMNMSITLHYWLGWNILHHETLYHFSARNSKTTVHEYLERNISLTRHHPLVICCPYFSLRLLLCVWNSWSKENSVSVSWDQFLPTSLISTSIFRCSCASFSAFLRCSFSTFSNLFQYTIISLDRRRARMTASFVDFCEAMARLRHSFWPSLATLRIDASISLRAEAFCFCA